MQIENIKKRKEPPTKETTKAKRRFVSNVIQLKNEQLLYHNIHSAFLYLLGKYKCNH